MRAFSAMMIVLACLCLIASFAFQFWPLAAVGVAFLVLYGHTAWGISAALVLDLLFGEPSGLLSYLHFPFLAFAVACVGVRQLALTYLLERTEVDTI